MISSEPLPLGFLDTPWGRLAVTGGFILVAFAVFAPCLATGTLITHNDSILRLPLLSHARHIPMIFGQEFMAFSDGQYRPLSYAILALVRTFIPADATLFWHTWLVVFHAICAVLVFDVSRRLAKGPVAALVAGALFLVHPLATVFGNRITNFYILLGAAFYLGSLDACLVYVHTRKRRWLLAALASFVPGLFASKVLMTLPLVVLLLELLYLRSTLKSSLLRFAPFAAAALAYLPLLIVPVPNIFFFHYPKTPPGTGLYSLCSFLGGSWRLGLGLLGGTGVPAPLEEIVPRLRTCVSSIAFASLCVILILFAAGVWALRRRLWLGLGPVFLIATLIPYCSAAFHPVDEFISWDILYVPLAGFALALGGIMELALGAVDDPRIRRILTMGAFVPLLCYAALLVANNVRTRTPFLYWNAVLNSSPKSQLAQLALGRAHLAEAMSEYDRYRELADEGEPSQQAALQSLSRVREIEKQAFEHLFSPHLRNMAPSSLSLAGYYCHLDEKLPAAIHMRYCVDALVGQYQTENEALSTLASVMMEIGAVDYAEDSLGRLLMRNPWDTEAMIRLARILAEKGFVRAGVRWVEQAVTLRADRDDYRQALDELRERTHAPEGKERQVLQVTPEPADLLRYAAAGPVSEGIRESIAALAERRLDDPIIQLEAGIRLAEMGREEAGLAHVAAASEVLEGYAYAWMVRSTIARELGRDDDALLAAYQAARLEPTDRSLLFGIRETLGHLLARRGELDKALAFYAAALRIEPKSPEVHYGMGVAQMRRREPIEAVRHFTVALDQGYETAPLHHNLGFALQTLGNVESALEHFRKAVELGPTDARPYISLVDALTARGKYDGALDVAEQSAERFPNDPEALSRLALLLSAAPADAMRDGRRALGIIESVLQRTAATPQLLDIHAAALAEVGRYGDAAKEAAKAAEAARGSGNAKAAVSIESRRRLYENGRPWRLGMN